MTTPLYYVCPECHLKLHPSQVIAGQTHRLYQRDFDSGQIRLVVHVVVPIYDDVTIAAVGALH